jgi:pimeloyl-ACP methyl ester carboxylesterase
MLGRLSAPLFWQPKSLDASVFDSLASEIRLQAFVRAAEAASRYDERAWSSIRCPVAIVRGGRDVFVCPNDDAWFAAALPHAKQRVAVRAGHFSHIERAGHGAVSAQESDRNSFSISSG